MNAVDTLGSAVGVAAACESLAIPRASYYRSKQPSRPPTPRPRSHRALPEEERAKVLETLNTDRFADKAPAQVYAELLDEERYLCSTRTMYRILEQEQQVRERRDQLRHPQYKRPELVAHGPNEVWSWDITKLLGPQKWTYFYLYVMLDIFSRYIVGWMIATRETAALGQRLIAESCGKQGIEPGQLVIHQDRGSPMTAKSTALLMADLGITKTHSRPRVSNDNPYSEAYFKTLKYRPEMPERFGCVQDARAHVGPLVEWYNHDHHHTGLAMLTPFQVHHGLGDAILAARQRTLENAYALRPERFPHGSPRVARLSPEVWINPPESALATNTESKLTK